MNLSQRQHAFFLMTLRQRPKTASTLFKLLSPSDQTSLTQLYNDIYKHKESAIRSVATSELSKIARTKQYSYLSEVHPDWLAELLQNESPPMVAAVLRHFPPEKIKGILEKLSKETLTQMPKLSDAYAVPFVLVELLKQKFLDMFRSDTVYNPKSIFEFRHMCLLPATQINQIFMETGYREIAIGMTSLPEQARRLVFERLSKEDREHVEYYVQQNIAVSPQRVRRAQAHLVHKEIRASEAQYFVSDLGFLIFAKSLLIKDAESLEIIKKKMARKKVVVLQRLIDHQLENNSEGSVVAFCEDILSAAQVVLGRK